ncbi:PREDICTED: uncharacterized protein LOC109344759 [Lupinus angustifolius]|uniref:uncharacterized protein LOC109344759 n=1 Tax=Lupinus angustifolius TaxID=3871 RepID=UPI00092ED5EC|nr:PREDICTED: uncharacterized protein LOC109344759 [Lupinus angustifolius]
MAQLAVEEGLPILEEGATEAQRNAYKQNKKRDSKAICLLDQAVDNAHFEKIVGSATANEACDVLEKHYAGAAQLKNNLAIEESGRFERMKIEELQGTLEAHEQRLNERLGDIPSHQALQTQTSTNKEGFGARNFSKNQWKNSDSKCGLRRKFGQQEQTNRKGSHKQSENWKMKVDRKKIRCYNCDKIGHYSSECNAPNKNQHQVKQDPEANLAKGENDGFEDEAVQLMMTTISHKIGTDTWYLDLGCSNRMTSHKDWLVNFDSTRRNKVKFADNRVVTAGGT